jgi:UDP-N-acetylmuramoyl-L-alanyl-D-glutamate--2,6-diaminopimelate ligase
MKQLKDILFGVQIEAIQGSTAQTINAIQFDSRQVAEGDLFVAVKGEQADGHDFIEKAIAKGAAAIVCQEKPEGSDDAVVWISTQNSREALAILASNYYERPSAQLKLVGVTGTNGKTTVTSLLHRLFEKAGFAAGLLSTIAVKYLDKEIDATHTTPDPLQINAHLRAMVDAGVEFCFMEVSSHGIDQDRIQGLAFVGGVFTNLSHDHLDYHNTFSEYRNVKKRFFDALPKSAFALTNSDDKNGDFMLQNTAARKLTYGLKGYSDFKAKILEAQFSGMLLIIDQQEVWTSLLGAFNAYNLLAVYAVAKELGLSSIESLSIISELGNVKGRFQTYATSNGATVIVDYAHTPDALANVLSTIAEIRTKNETLTTVVGCGGNRDQAKRPLMAEVAAKHSDKVIFTADNPRDEDPENIIDEMEKGVRPEDYKKTLRISNRKSAIKAACMELQAGDVLLIAGKGHESYQEIKGERLPFDDYATVKEICKQLF